MKKKLMYKSIVFMIIVLFVGASVLQIQTIVKANRTDGLICYWNFNEGSGSVAHDSSTNGYDGNIHGATWTTGKYESALEIKNTSYIGNISPAYDNSISTAFTVAAWIKWNGPTSYDVNCYIFDGRGTLIGQGFLFYIHTEHNTLEFHLHKQGPSIVSISTMPIGSWIHVAAVFDGSSNLCRLYINGTLDNTNTLTDEFSQSGNSPAIGNNHWGGEWAPFNGIEDEVRIYNRALNDNEIKQLAGYFAFNITGGLGANLKIVNNGTTDTTGVPWQIQVKGGILGRIDKTESGSIDIPAGGSKTVKTGIFFGFGAISITVKVVDEEKTEKGTQLIIFTMLNK